MNIAEAKQIIHDWSVVHGNEYLEEELQIVLSLGNAAILTREQISLVNSLGDQKGLKLSESGTRAVSGIEKFIEQANQFGEEVLHIKPLNQR